MSSIRRVFQDWWERAQPSLRRRLPPRVFAAAEEVVPKVIRCRTEQNGFAVLKCSCGYTKRVAFTCKARFCPSCGAATAAKAAETIHGRLLNVRHRHVVLTIPDELWWLFYRNRRLLKLLSDAAAQALLTVFDQRCRRARVVPGIVCTVQTFGRKLNFHPHVHALVTEGGLRSDGVWQPVHFIPALSVCRRFQYCLLTALRNKYRHNQQVLALVRRCFDRYPKGFRVNLVSSYRNARLAAAYCCRYTGRPPISESRVSAYDGQNVTYWYDDYRTKQRLEVTVSAEQFLFLLLQHLPPKHARTVRYYGLYARAMRRRQFELVAQASRYDYTVPRERSRALSWRERLIALFARDPHRCPQCGGLMELSAWYYPPPRGSPDAAAHWKAATRPQPDDQLSLCFV